MDTKHTALMSLHEILQASINTYTQAKSDLEGSAQLSKVEEVIKRREQNVHQIESFLSRGGIDISFGSGRVSNYSALEWTAARLKGDDGFASLIATHETEILNAYDAAIVPCTANDPEYDFLNTQYGDLRLMVDGFKQSEAAA